MKQLVLRIYRKARRRRKVKNGIPSLTPGNSPDAFGLLELASGSNATTDIVALHGLDGHREASWTGDNGILWLRDLLPLAIPHARIFSYGYDVNTRGQDRLSTASLHSQAINLITHLAARRQDTSTEERPVIFVAHSLGGVVLKSALIHANSCSKTHLPSHKAVEVSTSAVLFFGTPHQGAESANLGSVMLNILSTFGKGTSKVVKNIQPESEILQQLLLEYQAISANYDTKFYFESYKTPVGLFTKLLVPQFSAVIPGVVNAEMIPLNKNHVEMVKFESAADGAFRIVCSHLQTMVKTAPQKILDRWRRHRMCEAAISGSILRTEPAPLPNLPYQEAGIVGRQQALDWIHDTFELHRKLVLYGIGGIGKTGIAVEYVYTHRQDYDIIFWVNGDTLETTTSGFIGIAQQLVNWKGSTSSNSSNGPEYSQVANELGLRGLLDPKGKVSNAIENRVDILSAVRQWLSQSKSGKWLLICDNVDDLDSFDLTTFFPKPFQAGRILITSRKLESCSFGIGYEVTALNEDDGIRLLKEKSRKGDSDSDARQIVQMLEGLPLAIELAGAYIAALQLSFKSYLSITTEPWKNVFSRNTRPYGRSLVATWEVSYQAIEARSPSAANLLLICSFLGNKDIPELLFRKKLGDAMVDEALEHFFAFSLAKRAPAEFTFSIHPLVHAWARERLNGEQKTTKVKEMVTLLSDSISKIPVSSIHISICARHALEYCLPALHASSDMLIFQSLERIARREKGSLLQGMFQLALEATESVQGPNSPETLAAIDLLGRAFFGHMDRPAGRFLQNALQEKENGSSSRTGPQYLQNGAWRLHGSESGCEGSNRVLQKQWSINDQREKWKEGERLIRYAWEAREATLGLEHAATLQSISHLAISLREQGQFQEAEKLHQRALEGYEKIMGFDHSDTLQSVHHLAFSVAEQGRFEEAEELDRRTLQGREKTLGLNHPDTLQSVHNLAISIYEQSRFREAEKLYLRALEGREKTLGFHHIDTIETAHNFALSIHQQGRIQEAERLYRRVCEGRKKTLGSDHADTLRSVRNLAISICQQGRFEEAEILDRRALQVCEKTLGFDHADTIRSVQNLAASISQQGRFKESEALYKRALKSQNRTLEFNHADTLESIHNLASAISQQGRFQEAETLYRRACEGREETLGPRHLKTLQSISHLAFSISEQRRFTEAENLYRRTLIGREETLGFDHALTLESVNNLASSISEQGRFAEAENLYRQALEGREKVLGFDHAETLFSVSNLAFSVSEQGRFAEAESLYRRALEGREKTIGSSHIDTLRSLRNLALSVHKQGRFEEAEKLDRRALEGSEQNLGFDHADTIRSVRNLASSISQLGRYREASNLYQRVIECYERTLGFHHAITLESVHNLASAAFQQKRFKEAERFYRRALETREKILGVDHVDTLENIRLLASSISAQRRYKDAEPFYRRVLEGYERTMGLHHENTLHSVSNLAFSMYKQERFKEAEKLDKRTLAGREKTLGSNHPDTLESIRNLASSVSQQGRFKEAERLYRRALEGYEKTLGLDHAKTLECIRNLASSISHQRRLKEAEVLYRRALEGREKTLGPNHPDTFETVQNLAMSVRKQGRFEEARELERQLLKERSKVLESTI